MWLAWVILFTVGEPPRLQQARVNKQEAVRQHFARANVVYPPPELYLRVFKADDVLEVWAGPRGGQLALVTTYPICARSGELGPKRARGDLQVPEGFYVIERENPYSNYHLSLGLDYPNASDRVLALGHPGGDIFVHGDCVTIGCVPIENGPIEELYLMVHDARGAGARPVAVHIFPTRLDEKGLQGLRDSWPARVDLLSFWASLAPAYQRFEQTRRLPKVRVEQRTGAYLLAEP